MQYSALTKPHLWPSDDLQEARLECIQHLKSSRLKPSTRQQATQLLADIEAILLTRNARLRPVSHALR